MRHRVDVHGAPPTATSPARANRRTLPRALQIEPPSELDNDGSLVALHFQLMLQAKQQAEEDAATSAR